MTIVVPNTDSRQMATSQFFMFSTSQRGHVGGVQHADRRENAGAQF